jgi:prevent-host-death family protein
LGGLPNDLAMAIALISKSDNLIFMGEMTVTEVARNFAAVIAKVEAGEEVVIRKGGREVARLVPPKEGVPNGAALLRALTEWQANNPPIEDDGAWDDYFESKNDPNEWARDPWEE